MTLKDSIERLIHEQGQITTSELVDHLFPNESHTNRSTKAVAVYSKCRNLEKWGKIERLGTNKEGHMIWKAKE